MRRTFIVAALVGILGCRDTISPPPPVTVTAHVDRQTFRAGDTVTVTVTVFNVGNDSTAIYQNWCAVYPFVVTTPDGVEVGPEVTPTLCSLVMHIRTLGPHESFALSTKWSGSANRLDPNQPRLLPPGDYIVNARSFGATQQSIPTTIHVTN